MPKLISLYTGAGGLDYGFEAAEFDTAVALEWDPFACATLRKNRTWPVIEQSISDTPTDELMETARLKRGEADLLIGGPPCQPFSKSGYWLRGDALRLEDPRATTLSAYLRVLADARPRAFLLENVEGLAYEGKDEALRLLLNAIKDINRTTRSNYKPAFKVLSAAEYGVPQIRSRFFMVASRDGRPFEFPNPTHGEADPARLFKGSIEPYRTAWDAIGDVIPDPNEDLSVRGKWAGLLSSIPEGRNYLWHTDRGGGIPLFGWRRRYWSFLLKLAKNLPSWTLQAKPGPSVGPFHWTSRRLSARELCRLQTFPDAVTVVGHRAAVQRQVGNAVPSLLAEVLGRAIREQLLGLPSLRGELRLLPPDRGRPPKPEQPLEVPEEYQSLKGNHAPHRGTGKGTGAATRFVAAR